MAPKDPRASYFERPLKRIGNTLPTRQIEPEYGPTLRFASARHICTCRINGASCGAHPRRDIEQAARTRRELTLSTGRETHV